MILKAYGVAKMATVIINIAAAVILATDPTVKVAIIVAIPSAITGVGTLILGFLNRRDSKIIQQDNQTIKAGVDGINTHLRAKVDEQQHKVEEQQVQIIDKNEQLAHAKGRREGVASKKEKP